MHIIKKTKPPIIALCKQGLFLSWWLARVRGPGHALPEILVAGSLGHRPNAKSKKQQKTEDSSSDLGAGPATGKSILRIPNNPLCHWVACRSLELTVRAEPQVVMALPTVGFPVVRNLEFWFLYKS